jgi:hypothetical protein
MFAAGTFPSPPTKLASTCSITDPRKGGGAVRKEVILASFGKAGSDGMKEWGVLNLYEMAAFAILRSVCCASPPPLDLPVNVPTCDIQSPLKKLAEVASSPSSSDADVSSVLADYTKQAKCLSRAGAASAFGMVNGLQGGELEQFQKTLDRARTIVKQRKK